MKRYSVWENKTDRVVIIDGTSHQCAKAMQISYSSFRKLRYRAKYGMQKKWTIEECEPLEEEDIA